jgi:hypothetical protein
MSNGRTPRFGGYIDDIIIIYCLTSDSDPYWAHADYSFIDDISVSKASIKLTELIFGGVLAPKPRFSQKGRRNLFSRNPPYRRRRLKFYRGPLLIYYTRLINIKSLIAISPRRSNLTRLGVVYYN